MAVLINTPNNPSGIVYSTETIVKLAMILKEKEEEFGHPIYIISDEPYREIVFEGVDSPLLQLTMITPLHVTHLVSLFPYRASESDILQ